jgi:hypothetical protein
LLSKAPSARPAALDIIREPFFDAIKIVPISAPLPRSKRRCVRAIRFRLASLNAPFHAPARVCGHRLGRGAARLPTQVLLPCNAAAPDEESEEIGSFTPGLGVGL